MPQSLYSTLGTYWTLTGVRAGQVCGEQQPSGVSAGDQIRGSLVLTLGLCLCPSPVPAGSSWCIRNQHREVFWAGIQSVMPWWDQRKHLSKTHGWLSFGADPLRHAKGSPAEDKSLVPFCHKGQVCTMPGTHILLEPTPENPSPPSPEGNGSRRHRPWKPGQGMEGCSQEIQALSAAEGMPRAPQAPSEWQNCSAILSEVLRHPRDHTGQGQGIWGHGSWEQKLNLPTLTHQRDGVHLKAPKEKWGAPQPVGCSSLWSQSFTLAITKCKKDAQHHCICHDKVKIIGPLVEFYRKSVLWPSSLPFSQKPPFGLGQLVVTKVTLWKRYCMFHFGKTLYL